MEPMNLGSAPSSPSSPMANPNYLPAFLMGEHQPSTPNPALSPERKRNFSYTISSPAEPGNIRHKLFSPGTIEPTPVVSPTLDLHIDKPGPPKHGLFDTLEHKSTPNTPIYNSRQSFVPESPPQLDLTRNGIYNYSLSDRNGQLCKSDSYNSSNDLVNDINPNLWVTVFGFPSTCAGIVLARFSNCGTIIEKRFPAQGNWVHLKYTSPQEVAKALALSGKLVSNGIMVGVMPHQNKQSNNKENADLSMYTSPMRARSLKQSLTSPQNMNTVLPPQNVPQKSTGLVTQAMEYVFGW